MKKCHLFITLNPPREPKAGTVFGEWSYEHPQFDAAAIGRPGRSCGQIQGRGGVWFAGAWTGFGFHEDGLRSGLGSGRSLRSAIALPRATVHNPLCAWRLQSDERRTNQAN